MGIVIVIGTIYNNKNYRKVFRESGQWLKQGGILLIFPAGEISNFSLQNREVKDKAWSHFPIWLAKRHNTPIQHVYLQAQNSFLFYVLSVICKSARILLICHELYNKKNIQCQLFSSSPVMVNSLGEAIVLDMVFFLWVGLVIGFVITCAILILTD